MITRVYFSTLHICAEKNMYYYIFETLQLQPTFTNCVFRQKCRDEKQTLVIIYVYTSLFLFFQRHNFTMEKEKSLNSKKKTFMEVPKMFVHTTIIYIFSCYKHTKLIYGLFPLINKFFLCSFIHVFSWRNLLFRNKSISRSAPKFYILLFIYI